MLTVLHACPAKKRPRIALMLGAAIHIWFHVPVIPLRAKLSAKPLAITLPMT